MPSGVPGSLLSSMPSVYPTGISRSIPSDVPSLMPLNDLSGVPSAISSGIPSMIPTRMPSSASLPPSHLPSGSDIYLSSPNASRESYGCDQAVDIAWATRGEGMVLTPLYSAVAPSLHLKVSLTK